MYLLAPQRVTRRAAERAATAGGHLLAGAIRAVAAARPAAKPLHPRGDLHTGRLLRVGSPVLTGIPLLDEPGDETVFVRRSRAIGLPAGWPDIHGLAIRIPRPEGEVDLLLASTGLGPVTRFALTVSREPTRRPLTTLLPYRGPHGGVLLGAVATCTGRFELLWAPPTGGWNYWGELFLDEEPGDDLLVSFDPVLHQAPGLEQYPVVQRLREPSYQTARGTR